MTSSLDRKRARNKREQEMIDHYFAETLPEAWSWYSPTSSYTFFKDPSGLNFAKMMNVPILSYGSFALANYLTGSMAPYSPFFHTSQKMYNVFQAAKYGGGALARGTVAVATSPITAAMMVSMIASVQYEQSVNEPIRETSGGSGSSNWFGPFASGFGSVV